MKSVFGSMALGLGVMLFSVAGLAEADYTKVVNDPTVLAVGKLMNARHFGTCQVPQNQSDVDFRCMGAHPTVTVPTPVSVGCMFEVAIKCAKETALIRGVQNMWVVVLPPDAPKTNTATADGGNQIWGVSFSSQP